MKIHALTTGTVSVKHSFLFPRHGARRQLDLFLPGDFLDPLPIHCWAIDHDGVLRLVDTGETAAVRNVPFARMGVTREQELPAAIANAGLALDDVSEVWITHAHGDHIDGLVHVRTRGLIHEAELQSLSSPTARVMRRVLRQPLPRDSTQRHSRSTAGRSESSNAAVPLAMTDASSSSTRLGTPPDTCQ